MKFLYGKMPKEWQVKYHQESIKHLRAKQMTVKDLAEREKLNEVIKKHNEQREKLLSEPKVIQ